MPMDANLDDVCQYYYTRARNPICTYKLPSRSKDLLCRALGIYVEQDLKSTIRKQCTIWVLGPKRNVQETHGSCTCYPSIALLQFSIDMKHAMHRISNVHCSRLLTLCSRLLTVCSRSSQSSDVPSKALAFLCALLLIFVT